MLARLGLAYLIKCDFSSRGDIAYYYYAKFGTDPTFMTEYPDAGVWPIDILAKIVGPNLLAFYIAFVVMCFAVDAAFLALILRGHRDNPRTFGAGWFWVFFGTAAGQVLVMRLDLFPALAVAGAAALLYRHPAIGSGMLAFATAMKLWPGVLAAGLVGRFSSRKSWLRLCSFFATLAAMCGVTVAIKGYDRLVSPLSYQGGRGLQIESIPATFHVYKSFFSPGTWRLEYAASKSFEISGPGVDKAIALSNAMMAATVAFALAWALFRLIVGKWSPRSTVAFFALMVLLLIVSNKVFSPQYIVWFGPLLAVAIRQPMPARRTPGVPLAAEPRTRIIRTCLVLLAVAAIFAAALGTFIYPFNYDYLWKFIGVRFAPIAALVARNSLMVAMTAIAALWLFAEARQERAISRALATGLAGTEHAPLPPVGDAPTPAILPAEPAS